MNEETNDNAGYTMEDAILDKLNLIHQVPGLSMPFTQEECEALGVVEETALDAEEALAGAADAN